MSSANHDAALGRLLNPKSIAVVGASDTPPKPGYNLVKALADFGGDVYPVNPDADVICGLKAYPHLAAVKAPIDLLILVVRAHLIPQILNDAEDVDIGGCMIVASGFGETGEEGARLQTEVSEICARRGIRVLGPNTAGFMNPSLDLYASFVAGLDDLCAGGVGVVSQSGAMNMVLSFLCNRSGLGVSLAVGLGNMIDTSHSDIVRYMADDEQTKVILIYAEGINRGRDLFDAIRYAAPRKPVIAVLVGKTDIEEFASSHTGNLIGSYSLKQSVLEQAGAIVVNDETEAVDAAQVLSKYRLPASSNPGFGVVTAQAGPGMIITDTLKGNGISVPNLDASSVEKISGLLPPLTYIKNPVDTGRPSSSFGEVLDTVGADENIDAVLTFALDEADALDPVSLFESGPWISNKPRIFGTVGLDAARVDSTLSELREIGIGAFSSPVRAAKAAVALGKDAQRQHQLAQAQSQSFSGDSNVVSRLTSKVNEAEAKSYIERYGFPTPERYVCHSHQEALDAFEAISGAVVAKVLSNTIAHKTEVGGVHLNLETREELLDALRLIDQIEEPSGASKCYLIEAMAEPGVELILGGKHDASFGPVILLGMGGTTAEAIEDVVIRAAPITIEEADQMINSLQCVELLRGWRGGHPCDTGAVAKALVNLGRLIADNPNIAEMDLNPVRVYQSGIKVLDAMIDVKEAGT